jgi:hypothetical protein
MNLKEKLPQNAGNRISEVLDFKTSRGRIPPDPPPTNARFSASANQTTGPAPVLVYVYVGFRQALKYRSVTDIVRPIREIVRRREKTTGHSVRPISETEVYCLSDPSVLVSDRTVALSNVNQNVP